MLDCNTISECVGEYYKTNDFVYGDIETLMIYLNANSETINDIADINVIDGNSIIVCFENGLDYTVDIIDNSDMTVMPRGTGEGVKVEEDSIPSEVEVAYTKSSKIMYWAPFDSVWGEYDETEGLKQIVSDSIYSGDLEIFNDDEATVDSLKDISEYGLVILATHGISGENRDWIVTGEKADVTTMKKYLKEILTKQISVQSISDITNNKSEKYIAISQKWFDNNIQKLSKNIIINNSCYSLNERWADVFIKKGAGAYFGNDGEVTNEYAKDACLDLVSELVENGNIIGYSYEMSIDTFYNEASFTGEGQGNLALARDATGIGFEDGLTGWDVKGDCRVVSKLGKIEPVEGNYMALVTTGVGYTMEGGAISKSFIVPEGAEKMYIKWNYISAEFLEYIDSEFDDSFEVLITCEGNKKVVFEKSVNVIANELKATKTSEGKLTCVSPEISLNDYDDIWMTDWQDGCIDVKEFAGKNVTISFKSDNVSDTNYPSALLLDAIHFDVEGCSTSQYIDFKSFVRGDKKNTTGRSYIFYIEDFNEQAKKMRKTLKKRYGYKDKTQVEMKKISSENDFVTEWNNMTSDDETKIDEVAIMMHGNYYAIIIAYNSGTGLSEHLVTDKQGLGIKDDSATVITNALNQKNIGVLSLYTCNAGLLDAIDCNVKLINKSSGQFFDENVACAFASLGGIDLIKAYDGSVAYNRTTLKPRLSNNQSSTFNYIKSEVRPHSNVTVHRYDGIVKDKLNYALVADNRGYLYETDILPNGEVEYDVSNKIAKYTYEKKKVFMNVNSITGVPVSVWCPIIINTTIHHDKIKFN